MAQPGAQQRQDALDRVDVGFMEVITILVAGVFSAATQTLWCS
jgi:hypothetical protein